MKSMADNLFDESILTDVQDALESLHKITVKKYVDSPSPDLLPACLDVLGFNDERSAPR